MQEFILEIFIFKFLGSPSVNDNYYIKIKNYLSHFWNYLDIFGCILFFLGMILRIIAFTQTNEQIFSSARYIDKGN